MAERKEFRLRVCYTCNEVVNTTAQGIKNHEARCKGRSL